MAGVPHLQTKLRLGALLTLWVAVPYYSLQHVDWFPAREMAPGPLDRLIPFVPALAWVYLSLFPLVIVAAAVLRSRPQIDSFVRGIVILGLVSDLCFLFAPTWVPRLDDPVTDFAYAMVVS